LTDTPRRVAVFGGSFNPPHIGHVLAVVYALETAPVDEVLVVPVYRHPFAKELAPFDHRLAMSRVAVGWIPHVTVSAIEEALGGDSLTLRTLQALSVQEPTWKLRLLIGADVLSDLPKWHRWEKISSLAPPLVLGRRGVERSDAPPPLLPCVSSTEIRAHLQAGDLDAARSLMPARVLDYIVSHGLYTPAAGG
jgi:nicotinate-nucleotide adenylyltransferase